MISSRDFDYAEARLLAPAVAASEAAERLVSMGEGDLAALLTEAHATFLDACRAVRADLTARYRAGLR